MTKQLIQAYQRDMKNNIIKKIDFASHMRTYEISNYLATKLEKMFVSLFPVK